MKLSERAAALGYGLAYDAVVERFPPYEALRAEVAELVSRSTPPGASRGETSVLDIACGLGNVCLHLGQLGFRVHGLDAVDHLIEVARRKHRAAGAPPNVSFQRQDLASEPLSATFDVLVSMNTLYWHPEPEALLRACHRALAPGGRAVFLTYDRAARVRRTAGEIRAAEGSLAALRSLRWLVPTAVFERLREDAPRYLDREAFHAMLGAAGFEIIEARRSFLAGLCHLAWVERAR